jgi:hypothetical protein
LPVHAAEKTISLFGTLAPACHALQVGSFHEIEFLNASSILPKGCTGEMSQGKGKDKDKNKEMIRNDMQIATAVTTGTRLAEKR